MDRFGDLFNFLDQEWNPGPHPCWACALPLSHILAIGLVSTHNNTVLVLTIRVGFYSQQYGICSYVTNFCTLKALGTGIILICVPPRCSCWK